MVAYDAFLSPITLRDSQTRVLQNNSFLFDRNTFIYKQPRPSIIQIWESVRGGRGPARPHGGPAGRASSRPTHIIQAEERGNDLFILIYIYSNGLFDVWIPGNKKLIREAGGEVMCCSVLLCRG